MEKRHKKLKSHFDKEAEMFLRLWRMLAPFHRTFGWFVVILVVYEGLQIIEGYVTSLVVRLFGDHAQQMIWIVLFAGLALYDELFMRLDNQIDWWVISRQGYPVFRDLKMRAVKMFLAMDIAWHQKHNSGALVGKVANGVGKVAEVIDAFSWEFIPTMVQTVLSLVPLLILSTQTALVGGVAFVLFLWLTLMAVRERQPFKEKRNDLYEDEWHKAVETVQAVETVHMFGQTDRLLTEQQALHDRIMSLGLAEGKLGIFKYNRWRIRVLSVARRLILMFWVMQLYNGTMDIANFIFVSTLTEKLFHSFWRFARLFDRLAEAMEPATRLERLLTEKPRLNELGNIPAMAGPVGIKMEGVNFAYDKEYSEVNGVLHGFDLHVEPGSVVALVGSSGAGKTTIRKLVTRLLAIQEGQITVGGQDITDWQGAELLRLFSYVPQGDDVAIFAGTIAKNVAFPKPKARLVEVIEAAKLAGIHEFITSLPEGYQTQVGERGKRLSGGQKQRVALARAIIADRPVLILDEATNALDAITEREIQANLRKILSGRTAIIIAHRLSTIWDIADKIVVMDQGRKVEEGTHEELVRQGGLYAQMVDLQTA